MTSENEARSLEELSTDFAEARDCNTDHDELGRYLKLYSEKDWSIYNLERTGRKYQPRKEEKLTCNVIRSCIDGVTALLCENRTMVSSTTDGADWKLRKKARKKTKATLGTFMTQKLYTKIPLVTKHAGISGRGHIQVLRQFGRVVLEVVPFWEVHYNALACIGSEPTRMWRARMMDATKLMKLFPKKKEEIRKAAGGTKKRNKLEPVLFVDEWTLPSGPEQGDGWHAQFIPDKVILGDGEYKHPRFPIVTYCLDDNAVTWGGSGLAEQLEGIQMEINLVLETVQNNAFHGGTIRAFLQSGSKGTAASALSNALNCPVVEYTGDVAPVISVADMGLPQLLGYLDWLERKAYELSGISQSSAQSKALPASQSGRAALIQNQNYSKRFITHQQRLDQFVSDLGECVTDAWEDFVENGQDRTVMFPGKQALESIKYSDLIGDRDSFDLQPWSTALAGESPQAKVAWTDQMMSLGLLDLAGAMMVLDLPYDVRSQIETIMAPRDLAQMMINLILEDNEPQMPVPLMDLEFAATESMLWWQRGYVNGAPKEALAMLLDFHTNCRALQPPPLPPAPPGTSVPTGNAPEAATPILSQ